MRNSHQYYYKTILLLYFLKFYRGYIMENKRSRLGMAVSGLGQVTGLTPIARTVKSTGRKAIQPIRILTNFVTTMRSRRKHPMLRTSKMIKSAFKRRLNIMVRMKNCLLSKLKTTELQPIFLRICDISGPNLGTLYL